MINFFEKSAPEIFRDFSLISMDGSFYFQIGALVTSDPHEKRKRSFGN